MIPMRLSLTYYAIQRIIISISTFAFTFCHSYDLYQLQIKFLEV